MRGMKKEKREADLNVEIISLEGRVDVIEKCIKDIKRTADKTKNVQEGIKELENGVQNLKKEIEQKKNEKADLRKNA